RPWSYRPAARRIRPMANGIQGKDAFSLAGQAIFWPHLLGGSMHQSLSCPPPAPARRPLAAAVLVALLAPGLALAQSPREAELEARVAELERVVQQLLAQQEQTSSQVEEVRTAQARQPAAVPEGAQPIQATTITPGANP